MKEYKEKGHLVIDNFLPKNIANEVNAIYKVEQNWDEIEQEENDSHIAKFGISKNLVESKKINDIFDKYFKPELKRLSGTELQTYDKRCYKLQKGDYYKTHIDDYIGNIGCVYYVNKDWAWDWGGILNINLDNDVDLAESVTPKFNRIIFIDHENFRSPHSVSIISKYAKEPRYTLVSFNK